MHYNNSNFALELDFYNFVNNDWIENNTIPDDYQNWGAFQILHEETQKKVLELIENSKNSNNKKISDKNVFIIDCVKRLEEFHTLIY